MVYKYKMQSEGFKQRLEIAKNNSEKIKIIFQYPASPRAVIRKGIVLKVHSDSFDFKDQLNGIMTFSYNFICEISEWEGE